MVTDTEKGSPSRLFSHPIDVESNHLFFTGDLFQEFLCEAWAVAEQNHLNYLRHKHCKLHVEDYAGLVDTVAANADVNQNQLGQRIILPSSFLAALRTSSNSVKMPWLLIAIMVEAHNDQWWLG